LTAKVKRIWPPATATDVCDKPVVPLKPSIRKLNPIYATPSQRQESSLPKGNSVGHPRSGAYPGMGYLAEAHPEIYKLALDKTGCSGKLS